MLSLLFSFNGRISRGTYWLCSSGVNLVCWFAVFAVAGAEASSAKHGLGALAALPDRLAIASPLLLATTWSLFSLKVKRFHDRGQSGWWSLLPLAPVAFMMMNLLTAVAEDWSAERLLVSLALPALALAVIAIGFFVNLCCLPGTAGVNAYGDPPGPGLSTSKPRPAPGAADAATSHGVFQSAEKAMERAIAEAAARAQETQAPQRLQTRAAPMTQAALARAPVATPRFGRRPAR